MFFIQALNAQVMPRLLAAHTCIPQAEKKTGGKMSLYLGNSTIWKLFSVSMPVSSFHWLEELQCLRRKGKNKAWSVRLHPGGFEGTSLSMELWQPHPSWAAEFSNSWHNQPYRGFLTKNFSAESCRTIFETICRVSWIFTGSARENCRWELQDRKV